MKQADTFLLVTVAVVVLGLSALTLVGAHQYQTDRTNHRNTTVTNDHVENLPWSLLSDEAKEALK